MSDKTSILRDIIVLRFAAMRENHRPVAVEMSEDHLKALGLAGFVATWRHRIVGLEIRPSNDGELRLLVEPNRRIGKFEVVCPTVFEAAA